jgi:Chaperone of endosialidase
MNPMSQLEKLIAIFVVSLTCFVLSATVLGVDPPPDGGYPNNNTAEGQDALFSLSTGLDNTAIGFQALFNNTFGSANTAIGSSVLRNNRTGSNNTATGRLALFHNTTGGLNTATGDSALFFNTTGTNNTATGNFALSLNTTGENNTATGGTALGCNTGGDNNTANGELALANNRIGSNNTASGGTALFFNTTGNNNTATGVGALFGCAGGECGPSAGNNNTATGASALLGNVTGNGNTANGVRALSNNTTGSRNIALGVDAGLNLTTGDNNIDIGNQGIAGESGHIRMGTALHTATFIAGIRGVTVANGVPVVVSPQGQLGTTTSSVGWKEAIKPMDKASEAILALKPVTFRYKKEIDADRTRQFGLVAEDVEKVNPDLVVRDAEGQVYTVRYEAVNAMLLNEFLKEHRIVQELKSIAARQEATIARQQKQIEALTAGLQKVSAQIEASKMAPQMVNNP